MLYRVTFLNDNGWAIGHETVEASKHDEASLACRGNHPMGSYGRERVELESHYPPPSPPPTFDRSTGRYTWPERQEV